MSVRVAILQGPLAASCPATPVGAGAVIVFEGVVRPEEHGRPIAGLNYEAYQPMAEAQLLALGNRVLAQFGLLAVFAEHSIGEVPIGATSFRLLIAAEHRKEALAAAEWFIEAMKRDVPIWKRAIERD